MQYFQLYGVIALIHVELIDYSILMFYVLDAYYFYNKFIG